MNVENIDTIIAFVVVLLLLSLLITAVVQLIVWVSNLRGTNLAWGVHRLVREVPGLSPQTAAVLSKHVLEHPLLSTVFGRKITAIRKEELLALLPRVAAELGQNAKLAAKTKTELQNACSAQWLALQQQVAAFATANPTVGIALQNQVAQLSAASSELTKSVETWFDSVMDRTSEVFRLWTRGMTAVIAILLAFGAHVDAIEIANELSTNREARKQLVGAASAALEKSKTIQAETKLDSAAARALKDVMAGYKPAAGQPAAPALPDPAKINTVSDGENWLRTQLAQAPQLSTLVETYKTKAGDLARTDIERLTGETKDLVQTVKNANLLALRLDRTPFSGYGGWTFYRTPHFWGALIAAILLSLGAPFWHKALSNLLALRPVVAKKLDDEKTA